MPETNTPRFSKWMKKLRDTVTTPDEELYFIGHSLGCITILRYLETLQEAERVGGAVLVAGFTDDLDFEELTSFFTSPINLKEINKHCNKFVAIHSDNDPYVPLKHGEIFKNKLKAKLIIKKSMGHFSGEIEDEESCTKLPEVVESIIELAN